MTNVQVLRINSSCTLLGSFLLQRDIILKTTKNVIPIYVRKRTMHITLRKKLTVHGQTVFMHEIYAQSHWSIMKDKAPVCDSEVRVVRVKVCSLKMQGRGGRLFSVKKHIRIACFLHQTEEHKNQCYTNSLPCTDSTAID